MNTAATWLNDAQPEQRVVGAEQLSAYPTPEAEKLLAASLANDPAPQVRAAAAQSLKFFKRVRGDTIQTLLAALEDPDEEVRFNTLKTLERYYSRLKRNPRLANEILAGLRKKAESARVPRETQQIIAGFLSDRE